MKRIFPVICLLLPYLLFAQPRMKNKKYQGLLWEISGHGLKKTSYLFGTMHVSNKLAFHLADSFYVGIRKADMVALETNPESWQEDMNRYDLGTVNNYRAQMRNVAPMPMDFLTIKSLQFSTYDKKLKAAMYSSPSTINNLLYRSYGNEASDFEEDTYLDMYIYQCGKKWGKKVAGVEKYGESMKLMNEAYRDAAKDKSKKERRYDGDAGYSAAKLQEAYRSGNLDWLDSINKYNSFSAAFDEKFLYRRNEIQAASIDSILRSGLSLFVGVGAAHLPGDRGVIEILRSLGYSLRAVKMGEHNSQEKTQVEKIRVPVIFSSQNADDGMYKVNTPGHLYKFGEDGALDQRQYADMANGSYYMVTRVMTSAWMLGHSPARVGAVVDSLLYENIPGKIISRKNITRNGNNGFDIVSRTRRGDIQRYNIFVTPFEVLFFKMSGTGDYVSSGPEAQQFFGSIQLKENRILNNGDSNAWEKYTPPFGGFSVQLPHAPFVSKESQWVFDADDKTNNTQYRVIRSDIHNYHFTDEDSFDLRMMEESFGSSEFIEKETSRKLFNWKGYPAIDAQFKDKNGWRYFARFVIEGTHYYTLLARAQQENAGVKTFLASFTPEQYRYNASGMTTDSTLFYTVKMPVFGSAEKEKLDVPGNTNDLSDDDDADPYQQLGGATFRSQVLSNDSTGERVFISYYRFSPYDFIKDSVRFERDNRKNIFGDTTSIVRSEKKSKLANGTRVSELLLSDTASSRTLRIRSFYRDGHAFLIMTQGDTLSAPSQFIQTFFDSFTPADTMKGQNVFAPKNDLYYADFMSADSQLHKRAVNNIYVYHPDSSNLGQLKEEIASLNWNEKRYLNTKKALVRKLILIKTKQASDYARELYYAAGDTLEFQLNALDVLGAQQTNYSFKILSAIISTEPPVINVGPNENRNMAMQTSRTERYGAGNFLDQLTDSLQLAKAILPDILPLINLEDYKRSIMGILGDLVKGKNIRTKDYDNYYAKLLLEGKQEWKKQAIKEKQNSIRTAESKALPSASLLNLHYTDVQEETVNADLSQYITLLLPFYKKQEVKTFIAQVLGSSNEALKFAVTVAMLGQEIAVPDTLLTHFAAKDRFSYPLYSWLANDGRLNLFPAAYKNQLDLGRSKLVSSVGARAIDSIVYLQKFPVTIKGQTGFVHFYKYKRRSNDEVWRIASVGLIPADSSLIEMTSSTGANENPDYGKIDPFDFTRLSQEKLRDVDDSSKQLMRALKKMLFAKHRSGQNYYGRGGYNYDESSIFIAEDETEEEND